MRRVPLPVWLIAAVVIAAAVSFALQGRGSGPRSQPISAAPSPDPKPADAVHDAFNAAREGDVAGYLEQFTEPLKSELVARREADGAAAFAQYLRRATDSVKGLVTREWQQVEDSSEVRLPVEYVYADRNEVQMYRLRQERGRWRIYALEAAETTPTLIPYGAQVRPMVRSRSPRPAR